jgi:hypothetical protein
MADVRDGRGRGGWPVVVPTIHAWLDVFLWLGRAGEIPRGWHHAVGQWWSRLRSSVHSKPRTSPFLLGRIVELTGGAGLDANVQLVLNNARVAADIAIAERGG